MNRASTGSNSMGQGVKSGAVAWFGGLVLVFAFMQLLGGSLGFVSAAFPIASATMGYAFLHGWTVIYVGPLILLFSLIPAAILVAAGYSAAKKTSGTATAAAKRGAAITVGYFVLVVVSLVYILVRSGSLLSDFSGESTVEATASAASGVDFVGVLLLLVFTGIVFPLVFGAIGGSIAGKLGY